jgi:hypothetical protein
MQVAVSEVPRPRAPPPPDATNIPTLDVPL